MTGVERTPALDAARRVADAVLYEGYLLYPYRASSAKNQVRWQFGVLSPAGAAEAGTGEQSVLRTQCLLLPGPDALVEVRVRCLQVQSRTVQSAVDGRFATVDGLRVGDTYWVPWQEAVGAEIAVPDLTVDDLLAGRTLPIGVDGGEDIELLRDGGGTVVGRLVRTRWPLAAELGLDGEWVEDLLRLTVTVANTATSDPAESTRDLAARRAWVSTHLLLSAREGRFVSLVDPPADAATAAAGCENRGWWPVLVGDTVLVAPIILPDQPAVAPESPGDLFDATEIDEILTLRVMTMTDEEKAAARGTDPRAAAIIDRCDTLPPEAMELLHGARREVEPTPLPGQDPDVPWWDPGADESVSPGSDAVWVSGAPVAKGSRVRLRPTRRADAQDLFLAGQVALVTAVLSDVDGETHVAVVLEDDPAADLHEWYGRYWYFAPDEIEPLPAEATP
ncbi:MAG TPA: hypothetical protein VNC79_13845 [Mycobacteriales bacterium]|nr:hypothetical protein [Mycobacteriales bacterium]